ncbi:MAG: class I SAM-dependent methyltransferase [Anaerolineales bacterium]|nr:class I SAM-dependent methyltransferase [Anaerolineales bacterium]
MTLPNPFASADIAAHYESWYQTDGLRAGKQEEALLQWMLGWFSEPESILDVGCGTGHFTRWFKSLGMRVAGLDLSTGMIAEAKIMNGLNYLQGNALQIPFPSRSFDLVTLITTLEFLPDPYLALEEAMRIGRQGLMLGVINKHSYLGQKYKHSNYEIWDAARFFTPGELKTMLHKISRGKVEIVSRTTLWPFWPGSSPLPWGGFIVMGVIKGSRKKR